MGPIILFTISLIVGLLIFLGIPLLGWGIRDISLFFDNPARLAYALVIAALQVFALLYNQNVGRNQENRKSDVPRHMVDLVLIQIFSLAIVFFAPFLDKRSLLVLDLGNSARMLGFILLIPGFILMQVAEKHLDKQFSTEVTLQEGHKLIQHGIYKYIRHPRYTGILVFFLGISIVFRSLLAIFLVAALLLVFAWRIHAEEKLLHQEFGKEWEAYRASSWRMIPYVF